MVVRLDESEEYTRKGQTCFYADDFTGAVGHAGSYYDAGISCRLFCRTPTLAMLKRHSQSAQVLGIAGVARSLPTAGIEAEIRPALELFRSFGSRHIHYKVCSTFDSAPHVGNIGKAIEIGQLIFGRRVTAVAIGDPALGRYTAFGNHFVRYDGEILRLDRHPSLSRHPSTPMTEADLNMHLSQQTSLRGAGVDIVAIRSGAARTALDRLAREGLGFAVFDGIERGDFDLIAQLLMEMEEDGPVFCVVSQGLAASHGAELRRRFGGDVWQSAASPEDVEQMLVLSGSASQKTGRQIAAALAAGFHGIRVPVDALRDPARRALATEHIRKEIEDGMRASRNVIAYTAQSHDFQIEADAHTGAEGGAEAGAGSVHDIAALFATVIRAVLSRVPLKRIVIAGGDTCSHTIRNLNIEALEVIASGRTGGRLCRVVSPGTAADDLEVFLKAGQVGADDVMVTASMAAAWTRPNADLP